MIKPGQIIKEFVSKKGNQVILRAPRIEDLNEVANAMNSIIKEDDYILLNEPITDMEEEKKWLEGKIKNNHRSTEVYIVAEVNGKIVGSAEVSKGRGRSSHVGGFGIAVIEGYREEGIGSALMKTVLEYAKAEMNIKIAELEVYSTNKRAQNLYQKLGFIQFGILPNKIQMKDGVCDGIYMYKEL